MSWICILVFCLASSIASGAQEFKTLSNFDGTDGAEANGPLAQGLDGSLYGTTGAGGDGNEGTVFSVTPQGLLISLHSFVPTGGTFPFTALAQTTRGSFYGTTQDGGIQGGGTVFKITSAGAVTYLYEFCVQSQCPGGVQPQGGVILATDGNLYGTTAGGAGTVFKVTPQGSLTTLHTFSGSDGDDPVGRLVQAADGNFYGTTSAGGTGCGTLFTITPQGTLTTLHTFSGTDGESPIGGLVQAPDGNFYGVTLSGGPGATCGENNDIGTAFKITPAGTLMTLYNFCSQPNCNDGTSPNALVRATDGNFYGTTAAGGANNLGTIFKITPQGTLTTLHSFGGPDGETPLAGLFQGTNGVLYGTTGFGGTNGNGTIFGFAVGLGPFVETLPTSGAVGSTIDILSQGLTGTTAVSFNGTAASFTVVSDTYLTAMIPSGATTGFVSVTTPSATLKSNLKFRVVP
jgi:uncharacterized repeat protein (TIGR03803 family)